MQDLRFGGKSRLELQHVGLLMLARRKGHNYEYKNGKKLHSFLFVEKGEMEYFFPEKNKTLSARRGDLLFLPKKMPYKASYLEEDTRIKILLFDLDGSLSPLPDSPFLIRDGAAEPIFSLLTPKESRNPFFLSARICDVLCLTEKAAEPVPKKFQRLLPALKEMRQNFSESKKISYYAELCRLSEPHFRRLFREYTRLSPVEYRNRLRLEEAVRRIDSGEFTVEEAARLSGFQNMSFFYRLLSKKEKN